ncbi:MAG TPA: hypothetical protein VLA71_06125 [Algoriphagus sp.]|nr:hypothetical protein [Algoriphagus sp.]
MVIGDKSDFAVEYSYSNNYPNDMGFGRIWIRNEFIGTYEDLIYLSGYFLRILNEFKSAKELRDDLRHLTKDQLFNLFSSGEYEYSDKYLVRSSTFTDDFNIWTYRLENLTFILWKVLRTDFFEDLNNYKQDVFLKSVLTDTLIEIITKVETEFKDNDIMKG